MIRVEGSTRPGYYTISVDVVLAFCVGVSVDVSIRIGVGVSFDVGIRIGVGMRVNKGNRSCVSVSLTLATGLMLRSLTPELVGE